MKIIHRRIIGIGLFLFGLIAIGVFQLIKFGLPEPGTKTYILIGASFLMFFFLGRAFFVALKNVSEKRVESMDGIGFSTYTTSTDNDGHESVSYYYKIDETRFMVHSSLAYHTLLNGHQYRVYYLPNSKVLVNIEVLEAPSAQHAI